jgi:hypothetical protein
MTQPGSEFSQQQLPDKAAILAGVAALPPAEQYEVWNTLNGALGYGPEVVNHTEAAVRLAHRIMGVTVQEPAHHASTPATAEAPTPEAVPEGDTAPDATAVEPVAQVLTAPAVAAETEAEQEKFDQIPEYSERIQKIRRVFRTLPAWMHSTNSEGETVTTANAGAQAVDTITRGKLQGGRRTWSTVATWPTVAWAASAVSVPHQVGADGLLRKGAFNAAPAEKDLLTDATPEVVSCRPLGNVTYGDVTGKEKGASKDDPAYALNYAVFSKIIRDLGVSIPIGVSFVIPERAATYLDTIHTDETNTLLRILLQDAIGRLPEPEAERMRALLPNFERRDGAGKQVRIITALKGAQRQSTSAPQVAAVVKPAPGVVSSSAAVPRPRPSPGHRADGAQR